MTKKLFPLLIISSLRCLPALTQFTDPDFKLAGSYFRELQQSAGLQKKLWGTSLYGPVAFIDPKTRMTMLNEADSAHSFEERDGVFLGTLPSSFGVANTSQTWEGKTWIAMIWPLPANPEASVQRRVLMNHEAYHRVQKIKKLPQTDANCAHLDTRDGRILLQLELEALMSAIKNYPQVNLNDLSAAVSFRKERYRLFPKADSLESRLELNEGIAEFTGLMTGAMNTEERQKYLHWAIPNFFRKPSFVRSMAYATGPLWGWILQSKNPNWCRQAVAPITNPDHFSFLNLVETNFSIRPFNFDIIKQDLINSNLYNYDSIYYKESKREEKRLEDMRMNEKRFIDGPVVILPNRNMNFVFNPNEVQVMEGYGPVYPTFTGTADWGVLTVHSGGVFIKDWMTAYVPVLQAIDPSQRKFVNDSWELELKPGWTLKPGKRKGDFELVQEQ